MENCLTKGESLFGASRTTGGMSRYTRGCEQWKENFKILSLFFPSFRVAHVVVFLFCNDHFSSELF